MTRKNILQLALLALLTFSLHSCRTEDEILPKEEQIQFRVPIEMFLKFEEKNLSDPEFRAQNKQEMGQANQKNATYSTSTVNIPLSQVSYKMPFRETIEAFFRNNTDLRKDFYQDFGTPFYNVSTYTYGNNSKAIAFPILQGDQVTAFIHGIVSPNRDYVQFTVIQNNDPVTLRVLSILQDAVDNLYPKNPTPMGKFAKEQYIRVNDIEEITIIKFNVFSGGGGGFGYLFPGRDWWKDAQWKEPGNMHFGGGGNAMSGDGSKHKFPDYLDPGDNPCEKIKTNNTKVKDLLDKTEIKNKKEQITSNISTDANEKSFSFGKDTYGNYQTTTIKTGIDGQSVGVMATANDMTIEGGAHTHTTSLFNCFSPADFYALHDANKANSAFQYFYVFSETAGYAMTITNPERFRTFLSNLPADSYDTTTGDWKKGSSIYNDFNAAFQQFKDSGIDEDLAFEYSTAMVMGKYDMGISLSKQEAGGNFNSIFVQENKMNIPVVSGGTISVNIYKKTDDCNLKK
ncbi:hypothetical protein QWZ06_11745 [Chryseobacterium tructae]|uniref:DUF4163 domain-containing protein n=1 Tax=Chryseobacterium tructae TaxID=1037380 RepID=A0ABV7XX71_9FLAO|nr:hypothetical protein [Chryseobacterium tructae]MDN3692908.1 hypothetical protein [Chryseobacterium tructae]